MKAWPVVLVLVTVAGSSAAWAGPVALPAGEAATWLQRMADASRNLPYQGVFVMHHGERVLTLEVENRPGTGGKEGRLVVLDGQPREVRCAEGDSVSIEPGRQGMRPERRIGKRYFPDLLPEDAAGLTQWYVVRLGEVNRVGGEDCREVELVPRDHYRWGYVLCADLDTGLPLKATLVNDEGKSLLSYAFVKVRAGGRVSRAPVEMPALPDSASLQPLHAASVEVRQLPPGFVRVEATRRRLPNRVGEVEHWVFSDGLTYISLFIEPATRKEASFKGQSPHGMLNLLTRRVGRQQATVVGDAPWSAVEFIAMGLAESRP